MENLVQIGILFSGEEGEAKPTPVEQAGPWRPIQKQWKDWQTNFKAGRLSSYVEQWKLLTSDKFILDIVSCAHIELSSPPIQAKWSTENLSTNNKRRIIVPEIKTLLCERCYYSPSVSEPGKFISPISLRPQKDGSYTTILKLKSFNEYVGYHHFKIDTLQLAISIMKPHCFMDLVDLKMHDIW